MTNDTIDQLRNNPDTAAFFDTDTADELLRIANRESTTRVLCQSAYMDAGIENPSRAPATNDYLRVLQDTRTVARWDSPIDDNHVLVRHKEPEGYQVVHADGHTAITHCAKAGPMYVVHQINHVGYPTLHTFEEYKDVYYDAILSGPGGDRQ